MREVGYVKLINTDWIFKKGEYMEKIAKKINYKILFFITSIIMLIPSAIYLVQNKTILNFTEWFTFFLHKPNNYLESILGAILFGTLLILLIYYYFKIVKEYNKEFNSIKKVLLYVLIISIVFGIMLPFTTSDIFYYMGTGWIDSNYNENPYYTTVEEVRMQNPNDEILQRTGMWENQVVVYGPLWALICKVLSFFSFGNVTTMLYIFKISAIAIHILSTLLIYKITGKKKFALLYGLNPFILFEMITNAHNDIYLIFFILLSLYFLLKKKNIIFTIIFMALATCIKYVSALLIPFLVLYYLRDKKILKKILYCFIYTLLFTAVVLCIYLIYAKDIDLFFIMSMQQEKYRESIFAILLELSARNNINLLKPVKKCFLAFFIIAYIVELIGALFKKNLKYTKTIRKYNNILLLFIFLVITNLCPWYTSWLIPTIFWQKSKMIKSILYLQFSYELVTLINFAMFSESYKIGIFYLPIMFMGYLIYILIEKINIQYLTNKIEAK